MNMENTKKWYDGELEMYINLSVVLLDIISVCKG